MSKIQLGQHVFIEKWSSEGGAAETEVVAIKDGKYKLKIVNGHGEGMLLNAHISDIYETKEEARIMADINGYAYAMAVSEGISLYEAYRRLALLFGATEEQIKAL